MAGYKITTPPSEEPVTVAELKLQARITHDDEDAALEGYISAARERCEELLERPIITRTVTLTLDDWPGDGDIELLPSPVQSITSIQYLDADGVTQTVDPSVYTLDNSSDHGRHWVLLQGGEVWPTVGDYANSVIIVFVAGYGAAAAVPASVKLWIKAAATWMNEHRDEDLPERFAMGLLSGFRLRVL